VHTTEFLDKRKGPFINSVTRDKGWWVDKFRLVFERNAAQNTLKVLRDEGGRVNSGRKKAASRATEFMNGPY